MLNFCENSNDGKIFVGRFISKGILIPLDNEYCIRPGYSSDARYIFVELLQSILYFLIP